VVLDQSTVILQKGEGVTYMQEPNSQGWQKQVFDIGYTLFRQLWIKQVKVPIIISQTLTQIATIE
jgi:hypothetical protein